MKFSKCEETLECIAEWGHSFQAKSTKILSKNLMKIPLGSIHPKLANIKNSKISALNTSLTEALLRIMYLMNSVKLFKLLLMVKKLVYLLMGKQVVVKPTRWKGSLIIVLNLSSSKSILRKLVFSWKFMSSIMMFLRISWLEKPTKTKNTK